MSPTVCTHLKKAYCGAKHYVLRRCTHCRKFLGIILIDAYHIVARTMCCDCYNASVRSRHEH
ncbi:MAG: hypothetical protein GXP25_07960 [Planctomycetes bacterium]|nr:hypothetical protein [Planctomycetota bacterium]